MQGATLRRAPGAASQPGCSARSAWQHASAIVTRLLRLRPWQSEALRRLADHPSPDFLAVATPGAGKTTFALTAVLGQLAAAPARRVVVVAPTSHLKVQWSRAAAALDLHLDDGWSSGRLPADVHGAVVTYQQVATSPDRVAAVARGALVVLDEVHHAGDERAWGAAVRSAFEDAVWRLSLSGTPFRSDTRAIPFVRYVGEEAEPDFEYGYGDALRDRGVVRRVYFPRIDGEMEWVAPDGLVRSATFGDRLDGSLTAQRLRTALSLDGEWLPSVLVLAHRRLLELRRLQHPAAGGLVIASDQDHARGIAELLRERCRAPATVATSDDPTASARIARFATSTDPWIIAVRMVSEGVDIPRLRVGVFATTTTTELFFRQAVGRLVRWTPGVPSQRSFLFLPDDPRLRAHAFAIAEQRRHSLKRRDVAEDPEAELLAAAAREVPAEQLSLFQAISARALADAPAPEWELEGDGDDDDGAPEPPLVEVRLAPPPRRGAAAAVGKGSAVGASRAPLATRGELKAALRQRNADRARTISRLTGMDHKAVNAELNRLAGVRRVAEATAVQLEERLAAADRWLARL